MSYGSLDYQIASYIDQYKREAEKTINSFNLEQNVASCLSALVSDNVSVLDAIRSAVNDYLSEN